MDKKESLHLFCQKEEEEKENNLRVGPGLFSSVVCGSSRSDCLGLDCHTVGLAENIGSTLFTEDNSSLATMPTLPHMHSIFSTHCAAVAHFTAWSGSGEVFDILKKLSGTRDGGRLPVVLRVTR